MVGEMETAVITAVCLRCDCAGCALFPVAIAAVALRFMPATSGRSAVGEGVVRYACDTAVVTLRP